MQEISGLFRFFVQFQVTIPEIELFKVEELREKNLIKPNNFDTF